MGEKQPVIQRQDDKALLAFARFWPEALKRAREIGLTKSGLDLRTATDLARNVWLAGWYEGGCAAFDAVREEIFREGGT